MRTDRGVVMTWLEMMRGHGRWRRSAGRSGGVTGYIGNCHIFGKRAAKMNPPPAVSPYSVTGRVSRNSNKVPGGASTDLPWPISPVAAPITAPAATTKSIANSTLRPCPIVPGLSQRFTIVHAVKSPVTLMVVPLMSRTRSTPFIRAFQTVARRLP
jgi:hypothetical protein